MEVKLSKQQKVTVNSAEDIYLIMRQILRRENKIGNGYFNRNTVFEYLERKWVRKWGQVLIRDP